MASVALADVSPAFFEYPLGSGNVAALVANSDTVIGSSRPAKAGEWVELYANGLGPLDNTPVSGEPASMTTLSRTKNACAVTIGGVAAENNFCGLAPGLPGLYQINVHIPSGLTSGTQQVKLTIAGKTATTGIAVQ